MDGYQQVFDPVAGSLAWSALFAALPLATLFVLLGALRWKAWKASIAALAVSLAVAIFAYSMPVGQALLAASEGAAFGLFPIIWIVLNALWIYKLTEITGYDQVLRRAFGSLSDDQRIQAIIIAFCFGALLEALAGFGTPVAVSSVMLMAVGLRPMKAAAVSLVANTAPVAFGAIAVPITTLGKITGLDAGALGAMVGRQTPVLALFVPLVLVLMVDGRRGVRQTWPVALVGGAAFAGAQYLTANFISYEITDIVAAFAGAFAIVGMLRIWRPREVLTAQGPMPVVAGAAVADARFEAEHKRRRTGEGSATMAFAPYLIVVALFAIATFGPVKAWLAEHSGWQFAWPGLNVVNAAGETVSSVTFNFNLFSAGGTTLLVAGVLTALLYRIGPGRTLRAYADTVHQFRWTIVTVAAVLALAYVMNLSGQTVTLGLFLAETGALFAFLSPIVGWLGVAVTGSDTSSNSLFGMLQYAAAEKTGISAYLLGAANTTGGVLGKMISPQNLAIAAAVVGMEGREGELFRKVVGWGVAMLIAICLLVYLQSTPVLGWMVVG
ncbi:L-lactate permease [Thermopolyspora flexuosa]|uniref:L-lactate permease n=1 Tax=Thermopolyspora flexuosa TaxID=103836 RepID=A0A543IPL7_9ACTN|nr:L-lactate permease [Thermopolyspora flexuosa]TQM72510.1 lactate permease [Thermopolyspora flexuosa]GGM70001.1 L-lactate permease [Thermopolyspora flexuosa]